MIEFDYSRARVADLRFSLLLDFLLSSPSESKELSKPSQAKLSSLILCEFYNLFCMFDRSWGARSVSTEHFRWFKFRPDPYESETRSRYLKTRFDDELLMVFGNWLPFSGSSPWPNWAARRVRSFSSRFFILLSGELHSLGKGELYRLVGESTSSELAVTKCFKESRSLFVLLDFMKLVMILDSY